MKSIIALAFFAALMAIAAAQHFGYGGYGRAIAPAYGGYGLARAGYGGYGLGYGRAVAAPVYGGYGHAGLGYGRAIAAPAYAGYGGYGYGRGFGHYG